MGAIVNLNKLRKRRRRHEDQKQAAENRIRFGRRKAERSETYSEQNRESKTLEGKKLD